MKIAIGIESRYCGHKQLEAKIDAAKDWINEPTNEARRQAFQHMADLIAQRGPEYVAELEAQIFGHYL